MRVVENLSGASVVCAVLLKQVFNKQLVDFENEDQGRGIQYSQLHQSIANINLCKCHVTHSCDSSHCFRIINDCE